MKSQYKRITVPVTERAYCIADAMLKARNQ